MIEPSFKEFCALARRGNLIPVYTRVNADLDTPVSAFLKLKKTEYAFLLESVEGQEKVARYSFLGTDPSLIFSSKGREVTLHYPHRKAVRRFTCAKDPLDEVRAIMRDFRPVQVKGLPRFFGGMVGYMGYDMVRFFERIPDKNPDQLGAPDAVFLLTDTILIFDHVDHTIKIVSNCMLPAGRLGREHLRKAYSQATRKIMRIKAEFARAAVSKDAETGALKPVITSNFSKPAFCAAVRKAKEYIHAGDIIQVVLSQRFGIRTKKPAFAIYRALRSINPSPYMFFLKLKELTLIGASPEIHVRCERNVARIRPIAGTRPRGKDEAHDERLAQELLKDTKERAEHIMLVDLARNDLGRVCRPGTVRVGELMTVERYSHVMHLVSDVTGELAKGKDIYDCMRATFPAGTVSGSPKVRAMEIIDELEPSRRGTYAGCVGYFSFSHNMDTCITLRTIALKAGVAYIQAGAGLVADSVPQREYQETVNKARAMFEAVITQ